MIMSLEIYRKLQKGKAKYLNALYAEEIKRSWFICYHIAEYEEDYIPMLIDSWKAAIEEIIEATEPLPSNFREILYSKILKLLHTDIEPISDELFSDIQPPKVEGKYQVFVDGIDSLEADERAAYLLSTFGGLRPKQMTDAFGISENKMKEFLATASNKAQNTPEIRKMNGATAVILSTQFRSIGGTVFGTIELPDAVFSLLDKELKQQIKTKERHLFKRKNKSKE